MYAFGEVVEVIPAYGNARPCRKVKARFAMRAHHEACTEDTPQKAQARCKISALPQKRGDSEYVCAH